MPDVKIDENNLLMRLKSVWHLIVLAVAATGYVFVDHFDKRDTRNLTLELKASVDGVRADLKEMLVDSVSKRQFASWLELVAALNPNVKLVWPALPK